MKIKRQEFAITIFGKCTTKQDILELYNFGYTKESIVKKHKKDNKIKEQEARKIVEETLLEEICNK